ncbi:23 kDa integral membrane protein-like [Anticarsia gemmatalis]|uniref:23 kDa integral membrane protein-like n=1 Tax=Anticarsia gemmatalis TaxID=129554 RepID=UPI003F776C9A
MGSNGPSSALLLILNVLHVIFGIGITCGALWFFIELHGITSLRNSNHYLLDYNVYWPQALPWVFILTGIFVICVSCCGFVSAKKQSSGFVTIYIAFEVMVIIGLLAAAIVSFTFINAKTTQDFIDDTIWDVYINSKTNKDVEMAFGTMERRLQCCGAGGPRDYKSWRNDFPVSCCDTYYHGWIGSYNIECDITNKLANERHGCTQVATNYTKIAIMVLAGTAAFTALLGIMSLIVACTLSKSLKNNQGRNTHVESDSKNTLLIK